MEEIYQTHLTEPDMRDKSVPELRLETDTNILDEEWQSHPEQAWQWSRYTAVCRVAVEEAKAKVDLVDVEMKRVAAGLDYSIRKEPELYGLPEKRTESVYANAVLLQPEIKLVQDEIADCRKSLIKEKYNLEMAEAAVAALRDRKHALQDLVQLHLSGYCGAPQHRPMSDEEKQRVRGRGRRRRE